MDQPPLQGIRVSIRVRPILSPEEADLAVHAGVDIEDNKVYITSDRSTGSKANRAPLKSGPHASSALESLRSQRSSGLSPRPDSNNVAHSSYSFENVFDANTSSERVYRASGVEEVVKNTCKGCNGTVLVYGQTGTGKTFTMNGVMALSIQQILGYVDKMQATQSTRVFLSVIEVYNDQLHDLLTSQEVLQLEIAPGTGMTYVEGSHEKVVESPQQVMEAVKAAQLARVPADTKANAACSSRGHVIARIKLETVAAKAIGGVPQVVTSTLNLVDLAGSERVDRAAQSDSKKQAGQWPGPGSMHSPRLKEAASINRDLLALGNVLMALPAQTEGKTRQYVPYRDSKLTRLLQDSLGGTSLTVLIACITLLGGWHQEQTRHTLEFAARTARIACETGVQSPRASATELTSLQTEIFCLKQQLAEHKEELVRARCLTVEGTAGQDALEGVEARVTLQEKAATPKGRGPGSYWLVHTEAMSGSPWSASDPGSCGASEINAPQQGLALHQELTDVRSEQQVLALATQVHRMAEQQQLLSQAMSTLQTQNKELQQQLADRQASGSGEGAAAAGQDVSKAMAATEGPEEAVLLTDREAKEDLTRQILELNTANEELLAKLAQAEQQLAEGPSIWRANAELQAKLARSEEKALAPLALLAVARQECAAAKQEAASASEEIASLSAQLARAVEEITALNTLIAQLNDQNASFREDVQLLHIQLGHSSPARRTSQTSATSETGDSSQALCQAMRDDGNHWHQPQAPQPAQSGSLALVVSSQQSRMSDMSHGMLELQQALAQGNAEREVLSKQTESLSQPGSSTASAAKVIRAVRRTTSKLRSSIGGDARPVLLPSVLPPWQAVSDAEAKVAASETEDTDLEVGFDPETEKDPEKTLMWNKLRHLKAEIALLRHGMLERDQEMDMHVKTGARLRSELVETRGALQESLGQLEALLNQVEAMGSEVVAATELEQTPEEVMEQIRQLWGVLHVPLAQRSAFVWSAPTLGGHGYAVAELRRLRWLLQHRYTHQAVQAAARRAEVHERQDLVAGWSQLSKAQMAEHYVAMQIPLQAKRRKKLLAAKVWSRGTQAADSARAVAAASAMAGADGLVRRPRLFSTRTLRLFSRTPTTPSRHSALTIDADPLPAIATEP